MNAFTVKGLNFLAASTNSQTPQDTMDRHRATYFPAVFLWAAMILLLCPVAAFCADSSSKLSAEDRKILQSFEERIHRIKQRQKHQLKEMTDSPPSIPAPKTVNAEETHQGESPLSAPEKPADEIRTASGDPTFLPHPPEEDPLSAPVEFSPSDTTSVKPQIEDLQMRVTSLESQLEVLESRSSHPFSFGWLALGISMAGWVMVLRRRSAKPKGDLPAEMIQESFAEGAMTGRPGRDEESEEILPWPSPESERDLSSGNLNQWVHNANRSFQRGDYPQADAIYRKLLELQPQNFAIHCGIAELNVLAGRYEAGWKFIHISLPRFHQPDKRSILIFLAIAAGSLSGRETRNLEVEFHQMMREEFKISWNLEDMQQWILTSGIPERIREGLMREMEMLRSHHATRHQGTDIGIEKDSNLNTSPHLEKEKLCSG